MTSAHDGHRRVIAAADAAARALGLRPGLPLAQASARIPGLAAMEAEPDADAAALGRLAAWCLRYAPLTAADPPDGLWIDATGATHLAGGEAALLADLVDRLQQAGFAAHAAIADRPGAAHAVARYGEVLQQAPARPAEAAPGGKVAAEEPAEIIRWIDEIDDAKMSEEIERLRREAAGEPPLPMKPGPQRIYKCKPDDYALTWVLDERAARMYPGWENMTKPERREFFGHAYTGPVAPLEMLTPTSRAAAAAGQG